MVLQQYLASRDITVSEFAERLGVTAQTVHRYLATGRVPRADMMERIRRVTRGCVQPNDFFPEPAKADA